MGTRFYTVKEAGKILNTKTSTVRTYCREGKIPAIKIGRGYRIAKEDLEGWLRQRQQEAGVSLEEQQIASETEAKYQNVFEAASDAIAIFDIKGCLTLANPRFLELFGYAPEEVEGLHFSRFVHPEQLPAIAEMFMARMAGEDTAIIKDIRALRKDGQVIYVEGSSGLVTRGEEITGLQVIARDITERRRVQEQILVANERLHYLLSSTTTVIYTSKTSGDYGATFISDNVTEMTGYQPQEFLEKSSFWIDHVHPEDLQFVLSEVQKIFKHKHYAFEYRFRREDGVYIWVRDEMKLVRDKKGRPLEIVGFWVDVTNQKQVEEALRESEEMYKMLIKASPGAVTITDLEGNITYASEQTVQLFGYKSTKELLGRSGLMLVEPKERKKAQANIQKMLKEDIRRGVRYNLIRADGTGFIGEVNEALVKNSEGQPKAFIIITRDVSKLEDTAE